MGDSGFRWRVFSVSLLLKVVGIGVGRGFISFQRV